MQDIHPLGFPFFVKPTVKDLLLNLTDNICAETYVLEVLCMSAYTDAKGYLVCLYETARDMTRPECF